LSGRFVVIVKSSFLVLVPDRLPSRSGTLCCLTGRAELYGFSTRQEQEQLAQTLQYPMSHAVDGGTASIAHLFRLFGELHWGSQPRRGFQSLGPPHTFHQGEPPLENKVELPK